MINKTDRDKALEHLEGLTIMLSEKYSDPYAYIDSVATIRAALQEPVVDVEGLDHHILGEYVLQTDGDYNTDCEELAYFQFAVETLNQQGYLRTPPQEWQGIESAPKDGSLILVGFHSNDGWWNCDCSRWEDDGWWQHRQNQPTHWMPLPQPPKGASE